jgi:hypothetical protein
VLAAAFVSYHFAAASTFSEPRAALRAFIFVVSY